MMKILIPLLLFFFTSILFQGVFHIATTGDEALNPTIACLLNEIELFLLLL